jgi:hypothetical protein
MPDASPPLPDHDLIALGVCWTSALVTSAAVVKGFAWMSLLLLGSALLWAGAAIWLGGWASRYRIPMLKLRLPRLAPVRDSRLALPMIEGALLLLAQPLLLPLYRISWS